MPIQKAIISPANSLTMFPAQGHDTLLSQGQPHRSLHCVPSTPGESPAKPFPRSTLPHDPGGMWVTHRRICTRKEHPKAEESKQRPPTIPKMLMAACRGQGEKTKRTQLRDPSLSNVPEPPPLPQSPTSQVCQSLLPGTTRSRILEGRNGYGNMPGVLQRLTLRLL